MNGIGLGRFNHEAPTILEAFETSLETLGRWWSHHRLGRGHWNQWGVLLGRPFWASSVVCFSMIFCVIFIFVSGNMWHFYVDVFFFFVCCFGLGKKLDMSMWNGIFGWLIGVDGRSGDEGWWLVLNGWVDLHILGVAETSIYLCLYIYIFREGLATYIIPESSFFNF